MARRLGQTIELAPSERVMRELERALAQAPAKLHKTALRVLRRQLKRGKSAASKSIRDTINLKKQKVDQRIKTEITSYNKVEGLLTVRDRRIELIEFMTPAQIVSAYQRQRARRRRSKGVAVKIFKQRKRQLFPGTFVERGTRTGQWHVFQRAGDEQYPIHIKYGPRLTQEFEKKLAEFAADQAESMNRELFRLLSQNVDIT